MYSFPAEIRELSALPGGICSLFLLASVGYAGPTPLIFRAARIEDQADSNYQHNDRQDDDADAPHLDTVRDDETIDVLHKDAYQ